MTEERVTVAENHSDLALSRDLMRGADEIAEFLYGDRARRRKIYHLWATSNFPAFRLGGLICARKSVLIKWIEEQESRHGGR
jgi:hypothetical protein